MVKAQKERLSIRLSPQRLQKLREIAYERDTTMTRLIEDWIDRLGVLKKFSPEEQDRGDSTGNTPSST